MQNEPIEHNDEFALLAESAHSLQQITLQGDSSNRDRIMFLCGQAAAGAGDSPAAAGGTRLRRIAAAAVILIAFFVGGLAGRWTPAVDQTMAPPSSVANQMNSPHDEDKTTLRDSAPRPSAWGSIVADPERLAAIHSGQHLYVAMSPSQVEAASLANKGDDRMPSDPRPISPEQLSIAESWRVGMTHHAIKDL